MGKYLKKYWLSDGDGMNKAERMSGAYYPYSPDLLANFELAMSPTCASAVSKAELALAKLSFAGTLTDTEPLARLLLRAEAVSSSRIEGLEMPASKLLEYEELDRLGVDHRLDSVEAQVLGNLHAITEGIDKIATLGPITTDGICAIHRSLMTGTRIEDIGGVIREKQNWVGGNRVNPIGAAYVPPAPEDVPELMADLEAFLFDSQLPPVATAAISHAQLETIHPFADGNGRTGRALIHAVLRASGVARATVPPVSLVLATDRDRYISNLSAFRTAESEDHMAAVNNWVEYFANALALSCEKATQFEQSIEGLKDKWVESVHFRKGSAGSKLLEILPGTPVISINTAKALTGKSYPAARTAVLTLEEAGILRQNAKNRKSGIYVADDVLRAFNAYERSLATISGDTSSEKPRRRVPQRVR